MIRNDDGPFHWYCNSIECDNHNYYWYEEPSTRKLHLIPWDLDNAFENIGYGKRPETVIKNGPFAEEIVFGKVDEWSEQIREASREARSMHRDALKEKKWDAALYNLKGEIKHSRLMY